MIFLDFNTTVTCCYKANKIYFLKHLYVHFKIHKYINKMMILNKVTTITLKELNSLKTNGLSLC